MCIILTCEKDVRPSVELIDSCMSYNPDGAGLAWIDDGAVQICKGLVDVRDVMGCIECIPIDSPLLFHARIATSGGISPSTCHPFPICTALDALHATNLECGAAIAHNGIIHGVETDAKRGISDTVAFVRSTVAREWRASGGRPTRAFKRRVLDAAPYHNRFATLDASGQVARFGRGWETVERGIHASNDSWRWAYPTTGYFDIDDWDYDCVTGWTTSDDYVLPTRCTSCECFAECAALGPICPTGLA